LKHDDCEADAVEVVDAFDGPSDTCTKPVKIFKALLGAVIVAVVVCTELFNERIVGPGVMIISIYPHFLLYTNVNIMLSNIAILFSLSLLSIFLVCFVFTLFLNVLETFGLMP
jgi:hypothetical protein